MNRNDLYRAMDGIDDEVLAEAESSAGVGVSRRKISGWRIAAAACVCLIAGFAAWRLLDRGGERPNVPNDNPLLSESGSAPENSKPDPAESRYSQKPGEYGFWNILLGGFLPELMVNGKLYYWDNFAYPLGSDLFEGVYIDATGKTVLPAGYAPTGQISSVTENSPTEDSQLKAGFSATGTIYTNEASPEAVYVLLDADWFDGKGPYYIRFISDELAVGGRISWQGRDYLFRPGSDEFEVLRELPEGCEAIFTLGARAHDFYVLGCPDPARRRPGGDWRASPVMR